LINNDKEYNISEASTFTGFSNHVLRYYEKEFELKVPRNRSGHRYYTYKEIEIFSYIKVLKERGLSNSQIKSILKSPEKSMPIDDIAITYENDLVNETITNDMSILTNELRKFKEEAYDMITNSLEKFSDSLKDDLNLAIGELNNNSYSNSDKDVLISENARLKMKLKEKSYEMVMLKEKIKKLENNKTSFFSRIFKQQNSK